MTHSNQSSTPPSSPPTESPPANILSDVFSDSPPASPSTAPNTHPTEPSDIPRLRAIHSTEGYREGISHAKHQAAQPGFDEAYPLGAIMGLRVGYILGVFEGLCNAHGAINGQKSGDEGIGVRREEGQRFEGMLEEAREELKIDNLCRQEYWRSDEIWAYEVQGHAGEENVTFWEVADQHPAVRKWMRKVRDEVRQLGIGHAEEGFSGVGIGEGGARMESLVESAVDVGARGV